MRDDGTGEPLKDLMQLRVEEMLWAEHREEQERVPQRKMRHQRLDRRLGSKFKDAVLKTKQLLEKETLDREERERMFESRVEAARQKFWSRERRILLAQRPLCVEDFDPLALIGEGAFGKVCAVREKETGEVLALKLVPKRLYTRRDRRKKVFAERTLLANYSEKWFVELIAVFQDTDHFFMLMEFLPGGDFRDFLTRFSIGKLAFKSEGDTSRLAGKD